MKKIVLGMMAVMIAFSSIAQNDKSKENKEFHKGGKHFKGTEKFDKLNLSADQKTQMKTLNESFRQQMQDLKNSGNTNTEEMKSKRMALAKDHQQRISAILTPEQRERAKEMKKDFKQDRKDDKKDGVKGRKADKLKDLNLSADQSNKVAALNQSLKNNIKSIKENSTLTQDQKKEQMKDLMQKHRSEVQNLLNDDQKKQLKNHHKTKRNSNAVK